MTAYCVRCKSKTQDKNPRMKQTSNGRQMIQSSCGRCETTKCQFVSSKTGKDYKVTRRKKPLKGRGPFGSMLGSILGSAAGGYAGGVPGLKIGSQLGLI